MRLEDVTAEIRPRAPWESIDLGCSLARKHIGDIWKAWMLTVIPLWIVLGLLLRNHPVWFILLIWWLKPIYDRVPLMVVSRALFGSRLRVFDVIKAWPKMMVRRLFFALFVGRFSPARSLTLPIAELEGLRGASYRQRVTLLERNGGEGATMTTLAGLALEFVTGLGLIMLALMMVPDHISSQWMNGISEFFIHDDISEFSTTFFWLFAFVWMFAITVMEPFYVSAGFALYINSRTLTEGWDIELAFRRLGARLKALKSGAVKKSGAAILMIGLVCLGLAPRGQAETNSYQEAAQEVIVHEDFTIHERTVKVPKETASPSSSNWGWLDNLGVPAFLGILGHVFFWIILALVIAGIVYLIIKNKHVFSGGSGGKRGGQSKPRTEAVMGMDIRPESLPDNIVAAAREAWRNGDNHLALSILYRGSIAWLVNKESLPIEESDTEGDCLRHVQTAGNNAYTPYFSNLTGTWVDVAYGKKEPESSRMSDLCDQWPFDSISTGRRKG